MSVWFRLHFHATVGFLFSLLGRFQGIFLVDFGVECVVQVVRDVSSRRGPLTSSTFSSIAASALSLSPLLSLSCSTNRNQPSDFKVTHCNHGNQIKFKKARQPLQISEEGIREMLRNPEIPKSKPKEASVRMRTISAVQLFYTLKKRLNYYNFPELEDFLRH